jgi:hypothetical protein
VCTVHHVRILARFMRLLGYELTIEDVIESCHNAESSESGAEFRETRPIRELNGTKNQKVLPRGVSSSRGRSGEIYWSSVRIACGGAACAQGRRRTRST